MSFFCYWKTSPREGFSWQWNLIKSLICQKSLTHSSCSVFVGYMAKLETYQRTESVIQSLTTASTVACNNLKLGNFLCMCS